MQSFKTYLWSVFLILLCGSIAHSQSFKHPGINQSIEDLEYMRQMVQEGKQPWLQAFENLKKHILTPGDTTPHAHVKRGPYGRPNIGADALSRSSEKTYQWTLYYYLTGDTQYAQKATDLLMGWSTTLQDFDYNDAKLLAAWTAHKLCNAAEILRYTYSGWNDTHTEQFSSMLMTVYYPLLRYYFPEANGNWDGSIIHALMAIGIFTDNHEIFQHAVDRFLYGPVNGSVFKYIFPNGQCQETKRDQAHVQLGLGEFANAAHVAYTQGVDLFSVGQNRLALGFEYTAGFLNGRETPSYGPISYRAMRVRDDYEFVVRHYASQGISLPESTKKLDSTRLQASVSVLAATRKPGQTTVSKSTPKAITPIQGLAGALDGATHSLPKDAVIVSPGESLQEAILKAAGQKKWVIASKGVHLLPASLVIPSGTRLTGEGNQTILFLDPKSGMRDALINEDPHMEDVIIRDLVIEAGLETTVHSDPNSVRSFRNRGNRGGILFQTNRPGAMKKLHLERVTVRNATYNGVFLNGFEGIKIISCDFDENGSKMVPGPKIQHNLLLTHCSDVSIQGTRLSTSPFGSGLALTACNNVTVDRSEIVRNACYGILISESKNIRVQNCLIEGNDRSGVMAEFLWKGSEGVYLEENIIHYNGGYGIESYACQDLQFPRNTIMGNRLKDQILVSQAKYLVQD